MKINFLINTLSEGKGIPNRVVGVASELSRREHDVSILTLDRSNRSLPSKIVVKQPYLIGNQQLPFRFIESDNILFNSIVKNKLGSQIKQLTPDVMFVDFSPLDKFANALKEKFGYKMIYTYHGIADPYLYEGKARELRIRTREKIHNEVKKADHVMAVSEYTKNELADKNIKSDVVPNGVDMDFFNPSKKFINLKKTGNVLVYVGRYTEHKGVMNLLKAYRKVKESVKDVVLYMFARHESDEYVDEIKSYLKKTGLDKSVFMFRDLSGEILPYVYASGDLFVSGAIDETFGMTFVEAAASGTPSVGFASKSIPEVVSHDKTGYLAKPGDTDQMADGIIDLLKSPEKLDLFSKNSVEFAKQYSWKNVTDKLESILSRII